MNRPLRLGVLTPSSNTALEPLTSAIVAGLPGASAHFSRFRVTEIALDAQALGQFDDSKILAAAELLADAKVDVIGWSGTAAGWLGFERDRQLVERIRERTGIPATTAVLALNELLALKEIRRIALVTPYTPTCSSASSPTTVRWASRWSPSSTWASASITTSRWSSPARCAG